MIADSGRQANDRTQPDPAQAFQALLLTRQLLRGDRTSSPILVGIL